MKIEAGRTEHSPLPSDLNEVDKKYYQAAKDLYGFWIGLLKERHLTSEERIKRGGEFFDRHFPESEIGAWLEESDPRYRKTRAILIKELAYQDWYRVNENRRNNPPSSWYPSD